MPHKIAVISKTARLTENVTHKYVFNFSPRILFETFFAATNNIPSKLCELLSRFAQKQTHFFLSVIKQF